MFTIFKKIAIEQLQRGRFQPRQTFDQTALEELSASIVSQGLIEPLIVRLLADQQYEIIAGERRYRAAILAGLTELPCIISDYTDQQAAAVTLIENIQRENLNVIEEASGYQRLLTEFHFKQEDIASLTGKSRSHVANLLRLLTLCNPVQELLRHQQLSLGHGRMLVGLNIQLQHELANQVLEHDWSVRRLENEVRIKKTMSEQSSNTSNHRDILQLQTQLAETIGAPVRIVTEEHQGGWLKIKFFDNDTLLGLLERMGLRYD